MAPVIRRIADRLVGAVQARFRRRALEEVRSPRPALWWILPAGAAVIGTVWGMSAWLLADLPPLTTAELVTARNEAVRTALAAGAGVGAAITLMLAFRRQRHNEIGVLISKHDGDERRITDLYAKAAEQLGSEKPAVRLAALYALERLGQDHPGHRQTIVDVICAYLRMPSVIEFDDYGDLVPDGTGEREVMLAAQAIVLAHTRLPTTFRQAPGPGGLPAMPADVPANYWGELRLDLNGAVLISADFSGLRVERADFRHARFVGTTRFDGAAFIDAATFQCAAFLAEADFRSAIFGWSARFGRAGFDAAVLFTGSRFLRNAEFDLAHFGEEVRFRSAHMANPTFVGARFADADFSGATVEGTMRFDQAVIDGVIRFDGTRISGGALSIDVPPGWTVVDGPDGGRVIVEQVLDPPDDATHDPEEK